MLLFAAGVPLGLLIVTIAPAAWIFAANYGVLVLLAIATDALLACRPRRLIVGIETPDRLFIGEAGSIIATIEAPGHRRRTRLELLAEQGENSIRRPSWRLTWPPGNACAPRSR